METIVVYSSNTSNRLKYVLDWLLRERLQLDYTITNDERDLKDQVHFIAYGKAIPGGVSIPEEGLLWQKGITRCDAKAGKWDDLPVLFSLPQHDYTLPFDLLSAIFYLLSRYEEYYHYKSDKHNRYPPTNSILYKNGWLARPIVDEWVTAFRKKLQTAFGQNIEPTPFLFQPTYDIDMAYSHLHKGMGRIVGAYMRALLKGDVRQISERTQVLKNKQKDPYDSFRWLRQLHREYDAKPLYFILSATRTSIYDKNIHPEHPAMVRVIKNVAKDGIIGIHPSYYAERDEKVDKERKVLEHVTGRSVHISRQHYIRMQIPGTYRMLLKHHITEDYSMGYGSHLGFRAGTGNSFYWYDVENETITPLRVHPFCFMDTTAHFEARLSQSEAFDKLNAMSRILEKNGSTLTTIFHNFSLGTSNEWKGWRQAYEQFMQEKTAIPVADNV
jgi:hypothetical protein